MGWWDLVGQLWTEPWTGNMYAVFSRFEYFSLDSIECVRVLINE